MPSGSWEPHTQRERERQYAVGQQGAQTSLASRKRSATAAAPMFSCFAQTSNRAPECPNARMLACQLASLLAAERRPAKIRAPHTHTQWAKLGGSNFPAPQCVVSSNVKRLALGRPTDWSARLLLVGRPTVVRLRGRNH